MKKLLFIVVGFLLAISILRSFFGRSPLTLGSLLQALSSIDLDFAKVLEEVADLRNSLHLPQMKAYTITGYLVEFVKWLSNFLWSLVKVPIALTREGLEFLWSVLRFYFVLIGEIYT